MTANDEQGNRRERLLDLARREGERHHYKISSLSGADQADSEVHRLSAQVYREVAEGADVEVAIGKADESFRRYADDQRKKVAVAPKIRRGPSSGHSSIGHREVRPDKFSDHALHIREMIKIVAEQSDAARRRQKEVYPYGLTEK